ncbi:MAG: phosphoribosylformimino-5-aminoimidazole carboxamide ribotide isomerase [Synergistaceae bacterium]|jgi:phosphoribosylformimino-5-aminoimidazole carboxamide ribotide isomerase|nr:phosphoribosylformimino-5-aminoimidazole carboxamide ribotide isomerase [Synergistaceae bacterium]
MEIFPAMDLFGGEIVRLRQGRFDERTVFGSDIAGTARSFLQAGADWIHVIDLEGAKKGFPCHLSAIETLQAAGLRIQYGGGLRTEEHLEAAFSAGAERVYSGSLFASDPAGGETLFRRFGKSVIPAVDIRNGRVAVSGWQETAALSPERLVERIAASGFTLFLVTAVHRDGTGTGPDREMYRSLRSSFPDLSFIAAGGISSLEDIRTLARDGMSGAVLGRALYEGAVRLEDALKEASEC